MHSQDKLRRALALYAVTDRSWLAGRTLLGCVTAALAGGATFVQLREKGRPTDEVAAVGRELAPLCRAAGVPFVVNDDVRAALACGADGVHVGQSDIACALARELLGPSAIVGASASTVEQALAAQAAGASYLGVGAVFPTATKADADSPGVEGLAAICSAVDIPVVAIGGLHAGNLGALAGTGACGAAVVSALFAADDIEGAARELERALRLALEEGRACGRF